MDLGRYWPDLDARPGSWRRTRMRAPDPDPDARPGSRPLWPGFWFRIQTRIGFYGSESLCGLNTQYIFSDFNVEFRLNFSRNAIIYGTNPKPDKYAAMAFERRGGILLQIKSGLKIVVMVACCFYSMLKFFREESGGSEAPIHRIARWG